MEVCARLEATTRDTFSNIDDRIAYELVLQFRRDYNCSLCVIITEAAEEDNHEGNKEVDLQVDKPRNNSKKEKEKIHVSTGEWRIIMSAINHGTEVPAYSRREVPMGYQYALHQHKKKLREERDMFMRRRGDDSMSSGGYWDEYSDASESSMERHRDPKHNRRATAQVR
jgi:hypothetical protein